MKFLPGDVIIHNGEPHTITDVKDATLTVTRHVLRGEDEVPMDRVVGKRNCKRCWGRGWVHYTDGSDVMCGCATTLAESLLKPSTRDSAFPRIPKAIDMTDATNPVTAAVIAGA